MKIVYKNYIITRAQDSTLFDVSRLYTIASGKMKGKTIKKPEAYGVRLIRCFEIIRDGLVDQELAEAEVDFEKYLEAYSKINQELVDKIQETEAILKQRKDLK